MTPKSLVIAAVSLASVGLAVVTLVAWVPVWPCVLFEHFRAQYLVAGLALLVATAAAKRLAYLDVALVATLLNALVVAPDLGRSAPELPASGEHVRVLLLNVHTESKSYAQVKQLIADENPDIIGLVEVDNRWLEQLAPALTAYVGRIEEPRGDNFGIALYARRPVTGAAEELGAPLPSIVAHAGQLDVIVTHPIPPLNGEAVRQQREQFEAVAARARSAAGPVIVMGDFNATPWSRPFAQLVRRSGLCDSRAGFGMQASFPAASWVLRIPIDHVLVSCAVGVRNRRIGRDVGSDHLPVIVDLLVPQ